MPNRTIRARATTLFSAQERRKLFYNARPISQQPAFDMRALPTVHPFGRIIIVTPKKMGNAPQRNLVKRRLKALFYEERLFEKRIDVIVYCKKESVTLPYSELKNILIPTLEIAERKFHDQAHP